jgi:hypothetical protein
MDSSPKEKHLDKKSGCGFGHLRIWPRSNIKKSRFSAKSLTKKIAARSRLEVVYINFFRQIRIYFYDRQISTAGSLAMICYSHFVLSNNKEESNVSSNIFEIHGSRYVIDGVSGLHDKTKIKTQYSFRHC